VSAATHAPVPVADAEADREAWLEARAAGVSATEPRTLANGGARARRTMLENKLNGSTFYGNADTRRGNEREAFLADWVEEYFGISPNRSLFHHPANPLHMATPDGLSIIDGEFVGSEVKSHKYGWTNTGIPAEHFDQCQFGMHVTGANRWLYAWETMAEDGQPDLDNEPSFLWIERDDLRIAQLVVAADEFIAWRAAGAPDRDPETSEELDDALARHAAARRVKTAAEKIEKAQEKIIRAEILKVPGSDKVGLKRSGSVAGFVLTVKTTDELDAEKWAEAEPQGYAEYLALKERVAATEAAAAALYFAPKYKPTLTISAHDKASK
jgi:hypothetical protein